MGLSYNTYLNSTKIYGCKACKAHLANHEDIISRVRGKKHLGSYVGKAGTRLGDHILVSLFAFPRHR